MQIKNYIPKEILLIIILSIFLNILRVVLFDSHSFVWLFWNLFLAIIPFVISSFLLNKDNKKRLSNATFFILGFFWLLFIPNAPYIVSDLIHIGVVRSVPVIYDAFLLFSIAYAGFYLGLHSIYHIDQILKRRYKKTISEIVIFLIILFISFGIYLGRFLRFNSWDIFKEPISLIKTTHITFLYPKDHTTYLYVALFVLFTYVFYLSFRYMKEK
jgi:uncharacterized membrane protein